MWLLHSIQYQYQYIPRQFQYNIVASSITRKFQSHLYIHTQFSFSVWQRNKKENLVLRWEKEFSIRSETYLNSTLPFYTIENFSYKNHVIAIKTTKMRMYEMAVCCTYVSIKYPILEYSRFWILFPLSIQQKNCFWTIDNAT